MSCYICKHKTLETVLKAWLLDEEARPRDEEGLKEAWADIVHANYQSFRERYEGRYMDDVEPENELASKPPFTMTEWACKIQRPSKLERYDALKEYMYQCSEGDEYHHMPGYYKSRWCLNGMLEDYIINEFGTDTYEELENVSSNED